MSENKIVPVKVLMAAGVLGVVGVLGGVLGCDNTPGIMPQSDPALRGAPTKFAQAASGLSYPESARTTEELTARAQVGHALNVVQVANLSRQDWTDVQVWVNQQYVISVPSIPAGTLRTLSFHLLFDPQGKPFPIDNRSVQVNKVEVLLGGQLYNVRLQLAD